MTTTKTRKPRTKKDRTLRYNLDTRRLTITEGKKSDVYDVSIFRDEQGELLGVRLAKRGYMGGPDDGDGVSDVEWAEGACCCKGYLRWGRPCRHVLAVRKLVEVGLVKRA